MRCRVWDVLGGFWGFRGVGFLRVWGFWILRFGGLVFIGIWGFRVLGFGVLGFGVWGGLELRVWWVCGYTQGHIGLYGYAFMCQYEEGEGERERERERCVYIYIYMYICTYAQKIIRVRRAIEGLW